MVCICQDASLDLGDGKKISGVSSIAKHLQRVSEDFKDLSLEERMAAEQWIEYARTELACDRETEKFILKELNAYLADKVYFVAWRLTLADILMFHSLHPLYNGLTFQEKEKFINLSRWFKNIQGESRVKQNRSNISFLRVPVYDGVASH